jgi:ZIP family zinc transporter
VGALLTIWFSALAVPLLPYFLAFAAGAMLYVVADDLIPDASGGSGTGPLLFALGFAVMMSLDCALG